jgi:hypothetical protein
MLIRKTLRVLGIVLAFIGAVMVMGTIGLYDTRPEQFTAGQLFETIAVLLGGIGIAVMAKKSYKF